MKTQGLETGIYDVFLSCLSIICRQVTVLVSIPIISLIDSISVTRGGAHNNRMLPDSF